MAWGDYNLEPKPIMQRYERQKPGDLISIGVNKKARFSKLLHPGTGNRWPDRSTGLGDVRVKVAIDDATRLVYVEVLDVDPGSRSRVHVTLSRRSGLKAALPVSADANPPRCPEIP